MPDSNYGFNPSYLPEMTPTDFYLFFKLKKFITECKFTDNKDTVCTKKWLAERARSTILLQWNSSIEEMKD